MPYVYKYTDLKDNQVKYIGIIKKDSNFPARFYQHKRDWWHAEGEWSISYIEVATQTDAEMLEAHLIEFYNTTKFYNRAKAGWGLSSYLPDADTLEWIPVQNERSIADLLDTSSLTLQQWHDIASVIIRTAEEHSEVLDKYQRISVHLWFIECGEHILHKQKHVSKEDAFKNYADFRNQFGEECEGLYEFTDQEAFWAEVCSIQITKPYRYKEYLTTDVQKCEERINDNQ